MSKTVSFLTLLTTEFTGKNYPRGVKLPIKAFRFFATLSGPLFSAPSNLHRIARDPNRDTVSLAAMPAMYLTAYIDRAVRSLLVSRMDHNRCDAVYISEGRNTANIFFGSAYPIVLLLFTLVQGNPIQSIEV